MHETRRRWAARVSAHVILIVDTPPLPHCRRNARTRTHRLANLLVYTLLLLELLRLLYTQACRTDSVTRAHAPIYIHPTCICIAVMFRRILPCISLQLILDPTCACTRIMSKPRPRSPCHENKRTCNIHSTEKSVRVKTQFRVLNLHTHASYICVRMQFFIEINRGQNSFLFPVTVLYTQEKVYRAICKQPRKERKLVEIFTSKIRN